MSLRNSFGTHRSSKLGNLHTIEIDAEALEELVLQTLPMHLSNADGDANDDTISSSSSSIDRDVLFMGLQERVKQLANHSRSQDHKLCNFQQQKRCKFCCNTRLNDIALALETIIQTTPSLPAEITAEIHSNIGLLRQKQGNSKKGAIQSFLKALWIQSSLPATTTTTTTTTSSMSDSQKEINNDIILFKIAMTKHRLGLAFARNGNFKDSIRLLQNAVQDYQVHLGPTNSNHDHHQHHNHGRHGGGGIQVTDNMKKLLQQAQTALQNTIEAQTLQDLLVAQKKSGISDNDGAVLPPIPPLPGFCRSHTICGIPPRRHKSAEETPTTKLREKMDDRSSNGTTTTTTAAAAAAAAATTTRQRRASFATMA